MSRMTRQSSRFTFFIHLFWILKSHSHVCCYKHRFIFSIQDMNHGQWRQYICNITPFHFHLQGTRQTITSRNLFKFQKVEIPSSSLWLQGLSKASNTLKDKSLPQCPRLQMFSSGLVESLSIEHSYDACKWEVSPWFKDCCLECIFVVKYNFLQFHGISILTIQHLCPSL